MRPGAKRQLRMGIERALEGLQKLLAALNEAEPEPLTSVGSGWWAGGGVTVNIGDTYNLSVIEARKLIAQLVAAVYCCERGGNTPDHAAEAKEHAFLDALKKGLMFSLTDEQIAEALAGHRCSPIAPDPKMIMEAKR